MISQSLLFSTLCRKQKTKNKVGKVGVRVKILPYLTLIFWNLDFVSFYWLLVLHDHCCMLQVSQGEKKAVSFYKGHSSLQVYISFSKVIFSVHALKLTLGHCRSEEKEVMGGQ